MAQSVLKWFAVELRVHPAIGARPNVRDCCYAGAAEQLDKSFYRVSRVANGVHRVFHYCARSGVMTDAINFVVLSPNGSERLTQIREFAMG